jgi:hypothetical protein
MTKKKYNITFHGASYDLKERKLMEQTTTDLLKMIPFSIFILIPGLEILLPPCLYIFPNMIPSTFLSRSLMEEKRATRTKKRPIFADRLHAFIIDKSKGIEGQEEILRKIRNNPTEISLKDLLGLNKHFKR